LQLPLQRIKAGLRGVSGRDCAKAARKGSNSPDLAQSRPGAGLRAWRWRPADPVVDCRPFPSWLGNKRAGTN